jgi:hypothetical protein
MLIGIDENHPTSGVDPCSRVLVFVSPWCKDFYLTFLLQCNTMQCNAAACKGVIYCVYVCIRLIEIGDCRAVVLGRGALRRGWVGPPRGIHRLFCCLYRCVGWTGGVGVRFSPSPSLSNSLCCFYLFWLFTLEQLGMPSVGSEQPTAKSGHDRAEQS